jgi:hypothetical protein
MCGLNQRDNVRTTLLSGPIPNSWASVESGEPFGAIGSDLLKQYEYIEEEYFVTGVGDVYCYDEDWIVKIQRADLPFTTRILVRRPSRSDSFSGNVIVEPLAVPGDFSIVFNQCCDYFLPHGDVWVGVTIGPFSAEFPRVFDPRRYASLNLVDEGQIFDILGQVGATFRTDGNPLQDLAVRRVFLTGSSHLGLLVLTYLSEGFHERARLRADAPIFDGYVVCVAHGSLSRYRICSPPQGVHNWHLDMLAHPAEEYPWDDRRRTVNPCDVPVMVIVSESDVAIAASPPSLRDNPLPYAHDFPPTPEARLRYRRADSDDPGSQYRAYEIAGCPHKPPPDEVEASGGAKRQLTNAQLHTFGLGGFDARLTVGVADPVSDFPLRYWICGAWANMCRWVDDGVPPPRADPIQIDEATMTIIRDEHGNALGGVRSPHLDVPIATYNGLNHRGPAPLAYFPANMAVRGTKIPFPAEKLASLYGSHDTYTQQLNGRTDELVAERWILPFHAEAIKAAGARTKHLF